MIDTVSRIDWHASAGGTLWHRASALSKLMLATGIIGLAIATPRLPLLAALFVAALLLALTSRLPFRLVLAAAGYPVMFSLLFVIGTWDGTWVTPLRLLARPITASLTAVWLVGTTPYPDLFAPLSRLLPRAAGDGLFLTYRALFELVGRIERLWRAMRLRGGAAAPVRRRMTLAGEGLGTLVLYGFERSQRLVGVMQLRGYSGRVCGCRHWAEFTRADIAVLAAGAVVAAAAMSLWRLP
jgi:cobalt/nickel transport system permease protein